MTFSQLGATASRGVQRKFRAIAHGGIQRKFEGGEHAHQRRTEKAGGHRAQGHTKKLGDSANRGIQRKLGNTAHRGIQRKLGDTANRGVQREFSRRQILIQRTLYDPITPHSRQQQTKFGVAIATNPRWNRTDRQTDCQQERRTKRYL